MAKGCAQHLFRDKLESLSSIVLHHAADAATPDQPIPLRTEPHQRHIAHYSREKTKLQKMNCTYTLYVIYEYTQFYQQAMK